MSFNCWMRWNAASAARVANLLISFFAGRYPTETTAQQQIRITHDDATNTVFVQVNNLDTQNTRFLATITDISSGTVVGTQDLMQEGSTSLWSNRVGVGAVPSSVPKTNNRTVTIQDFLGTVSGDSDSNDFKAWSPASMAGS